MHLKADIFQQAFRAKPPNLQGNLSNLLFDRRKLLVQRTSHHHLDELRLGDVRNQFRPHIFPVTHNRYAVSQRKNFLHPM